MMLFKHATQRTVAGRRGCNRRASWPPSLSSPRWAWAMKIEEASLPADVKAAIPGLLPEIIEYLELERAGSTRRRSNLVPTSRWTIPSVLWCLITPRMFMECFSVLVA
jgi:hypothetical protein